MRLVGFLTLLSLPLFSHADLITCEQRQSLCETECHVTNISNDSAIKSCKAHCLGARAACSLASGTETAKSWAEKAIEAGKLAGDETKAFLEGFNNNKQP